MSRPLPSKMSKKKCRKFLQAHRNKLRELVIAPKDQLEAYHKAGWELIQTILALSSQLRDEDIYEITDEIIAAYDLIATRAGVRVYIYGDYDTEEEAQTAAGLNESMEARIQRITQLIAQERTRRILKEQKKYNHEQP